MPRAKIDSSNVIAEVEAMKKKYPKKTQVAIFELMGINPGLYFTAKRKQGKEPVAAKKALKKTRKKSPKYEILSASAPEPAKLAMVFGTPAQIREFMGGLQ